MARFDNFIIGLVAVGVASGATHAHGSRLTTHRSEAASVEHSDDDTMVGGPLARLGDQSRSLASSMPHRKLIFDPIWDFIMGVLNWFLNLFGKGGEDNGTTDQEPHPDNQFTPNVADWSTFYDKPAASTDVVDHSPNGVLWLDNTAWPQWDGNVIDPSTMTEAQFHQKICPTADTILGLRELYYNGPQGEPFFTDAMNPTKAEVDAWHAASITHLRKLVGIDHPAKPDHCLFARALWGQEIKRTDKWDRDYPDSICGAGSNAHCGATFILDDEDQIPYLPDSGIIETCSRTAGSEGISSSAKSNIPWSVKWVRVFCSFLATEGHNGGHVGPFFRREKFGWSFMDMDPSNANSNAVFRGKWSGALITPPWSVPKSYEEIFMTD